MIYILEGSMSNVNTAANANSHHRMVYSDINEYI